LLAGLVLAAPALAAYTTPRLEVRNPSERLGAAGPLTIALSQSREDDATFRLAIYVPLGYGGELVKAPATRMGTVEARVNAKAISPDAIVPVSGTIDAADPTPYRTNPQSVGCAGGANFNGVIVLTLTAAGQTLSVPMYVFTPLTGPEAAVASAKLVACLPSPDIPQSSGGAALGAKLIDATLTFTNVFVNPTTAGNYVWRTLWTPWTFPATPNPLGTVETQSVDSLPAQLTVTVGRRNPTTRRTIVRGTLTEGGQGVAGATVRLQMSRRQNGGYRRVANVPTNASGNWTTSVRLLAPGVYYFRASVRVPERQIACATPLSAAPCLASNKSAFQIINTRPVRVRVR
jgi:hypothetical protein